jgi:hypothetical protein
MDRVVSSAQPRPASSATSSRQQQGQARAVGREGPPVGPRRAPVRPKRARHELGPLLPVVLVAQVEVVITPQALGHHEVVPLVARDLKPGSVAQSDAGVQCPGRDQQQPRRCPHEGPSRQAGLEDAQQSEERGDGDENERRGAAEKPQARQTLDQRVDPGHADRQHDAQRQIRRKASPAWRLHATEILTGRAAPGLTGSRSRHGQRTRGYTLARQTTARIRESEGFASCRLPRNLLTLPRPRA